MSKRRAALTVTTAMALSGCWFQPGFDARKSGHNPLERTITAANVATLRLTPLPLSAEEPVLDPVVEGGHVFAVSGNTLYRFDGFDHDEVQVMPDDGSTGPFVVGAPSMRGDDVLVPTYVPMDPAPAYGAVHRFDAATLTRGEPASADPATGSVTVTDDGLVSTMWQGRTPDQPGYARLDVTADDPAVRWHTHLGDRLHPAPASRPAVGEDRIAVQVDSRVHAYPVAPMTDCPVDPAGAVRCEPEWSVDLNDVTGPPVLSDDEAMVYVAGSGDRPDGVAALDAADGSGRWFGAVGQGSAVAGPVTVGDGWVYVIGNRVSAFRADGCGAPICLPVWSSPLEWGPEAQAVLAGGLLYVASQLGVLRVFDASGCGRPECPTLWSRSLFVEITGGPVVAEGKLVVGTADGSLMVFEPWPRG